MLCATKTNIIRRIDEGQKSKTGQRLCISKNCIWLCLIVGFVGLIKYSSFILLVQLT